MPPSPPFLCQFVFHLVADIIGPDEVIRSILPCDIAKEGEIVPGGRAGGASNEVETRKRPRADIGATGSPEAPRPSGEPVRLYWRTPVFEDSSNVKYGVTDGDEEALFVDLTFEISSSTQIAPTRSSAADPSRSVPRAEVCLGALIRQGQDGAEYFRSSPITVRHLKAYFNSIDVVLDARDGARPVAKLLAGALKRLGRRASSRASQPHAKITKRGEDSKTRKINVNLYHADLCEWGVLAASSDATFSSGGEGRIGRLALEMILANLRKEDAEQAERESRSEEDDSAKVVSDLANNPYNKTKNEKREQEELETNQRLEAAFQTWWHGGADAAAKSDNLVDADENAPLMAAAHGTVETTSFAGGEAGSEGGSHLPSQHSAASRKGREGGRGRSGTPPIVPSPMSSPSKLTQDSTQLQGTMDLSLSQGSASARRAKTKKPSSAVYVRQRGRGFNGGAGGKKKRGAMTFGKID